MCLALYTYFSIPWCNPPADTWVQTILWVLNSTRHSLKQSLMVVVVVIMIMFLTYDSFISLLDTEGDKKGNVARIILERIQQLTSRDDAQQHGS
jgi:hypothetical protein